MHLDQVDILIVDEDSDSLPGHTEFPERQLVGLVGLWGWWGARGSNPEPTD
jgi:hypothetical protein